MLLNTWTKINLPLSNLITVSANNYTRNLDSFCIFLFNLHKSFTQRKKNTASVYKQQIFFYKKWSRKGQESRK